MDGPEKTVAPKVLPTDERGFGTSAKVRPLNAQERLTDESNDASEELCDPSEADAEGDCNVGVLAGRRGSDKVRNLICQKDSSLTEIPRMPVLYHERVKQLVAKANSPVASKEGQPTEMEGGSKQDEHAPRGRKSPILPE